MYMGVAARCVGRRNGAGRSARWNGELRFELPAFAPDLQILERRTTLETPSAAHGSLCRELPAAARLERRRDTHPLARFASVFAQPRRLAPMNWPTRVSFALIGASLAAWSFAAELPADATAMTFEQAAQRTLSSRPEWRRFTLEREAAAARREQAQLRPALELALDAEGALGNGSFQGLDGAELTVSLNSVLERGDKRALRVNIADLSMGLLSVEQRIEGLDRLSEAGRRFIELGVAQERVRLAIAAFEQREATVALIAPRVSAARSPRSELLNAQIDLTEARLARIEAQRGLVAAQSSLGAQWGEIEARPVAALAVYELPAVTSVDSIEPRLESVPDLQRFASEAALRDAETRLARANDLIDWRWTAGIRRYQDVREQALVLGISVPLNAARRNAPFVREAEASRAIVQHRADATRLELRSLLHRQWQLLESLRARVTGITDEMLPAARESLQITERGYRIGRFAYRELSLVQAQLLDLELQRLDAAAQFHLTRLEIERLTGAQINLIPE